MLLPKRNLSLNRSMNLKMQSLFHMMSHIRKKLPISVRRKKVNLIKTIRPMNPA